MAQEQQALALQQAEAAKKQPLPRKRKVSSGSAQLMQDRILKAPKLDKVTIGNYLQVSLRLILRMENLTRN